MYNGDIVPEAYIKIRMIKIINKIINPFWIGVVILLVSLAVIILASRALYTQTVELLTENLRERIITISITAAASIDAQDLETLQSEADWQKPEWARVVNKLNKIKYGNRDIVFMYIFRKDPQDLSQMEFVADADSIDPYANISEDPLRLVDVNRDGIVEPDGPDKLQFPGQPYPEAIDIPEAFEAYNGPLTSRELYTDSYGTVLTGYAPIRDQNGNTVAVLATDIKADDFFTITRQTLQPFLIFIAFLVLIISILTLTIITTWRKHSRSLEKLNSQVTAANDRLKIMDRQKTEFVSLASHQLRSPLTSIQGHISLVIDGDYGKLPPHLEEPLKRILRSTKSMIQIVGDFLDVSRIELGTMKYSYTGFDLKKLLETIVSEFKPVIDDSGLKFKFESKPGEYLFYGDENKIKQVFNNLLDNAFKYTKKGHVNVSLEKNGNKYLFKVSDSGVGMKKEMIPQVFEKFIRATNANHANVVGTGLGLYVAKQMVEKHGGRIWAESEGEGKGATFFVELVLK